MSQIITEGNEGNEVERRSSLPSFASVAWSGLVLVVHAGITHYLFSVAFGPARRHSAFAVMNSAPRTRLLVFFYGVLALSAARKVEYSGFHIVGLGWFQVVGWAASFFLASWLLRVPQMFPIWGWLSLLGCGFTIASGPLVAARPWPWALYLGDVVITGLGAYFFLFDRTVARYASNVKNGSATSELGGAGNRSQPVGPENNRTPSATGSGG